MRYEIAICDDDIPFLRYFERLVNDILARNQIPHQLSCFSKGESLLQEYKRKITHYDIIFLDIDMPNLDGKALATELRKYDKNFELLFISSMADEVFKVFSYGMASFISKSMIEEMLEPELLRTLTVCNKKRAEWRLLKVYSDGNIYNTLKIRTQDIAYFDCVGGKIFLHRTEKALPELRVIYTSFEKLKKEYNEYGFVEVHREITVNVAHISLLEKEKSVVLDCGYILPMSRRRKNEIFRRMTESIISVKYDE